MFQKSSADVLAERNSFLYLNYELIESGNFGCVLTCKVSRMDRVLVYDMYEFYMFKKLMKKEKKNGRKDRSEK